MATDAEIAALLATGLPARQVARELHASRERIHRIRDEHDIAVWQAPVPDHGTDARYQRDCRCVLCVEAHAHVNAAEHARAQRTPRGDRFPADRSEHTATLHADDQRRTRDAAERHYAAWTEADLKTALDYSHSATEAATLLGRTRSSVLHARIRYGGDGSATGPLPRGLRAKRE